MYSLENIAATARLASDKDRRKRMGLLVAFGTSILVWAAIAFIALRIF
jgi:hypothetical protein